MQTKQPKSVGERFHLIVSRENHEWLKQIARVATFAENAMWLKWRMTDPVTPDQVADWPRIKEETGKWPKLEPFKVESATKYARLLCPGIHSATYDSIANHVGKLYLKNRRSYLRFEERIPMSRDLRIRFREKAIRVRRCPENEKWFEVGLSFVPGEPKWFGMKPRGANEFTWLWLAAMSDTKDHPSGGCLSMIRKNRKWVWQLSLARCRYDGERTQVEPIDGRELHVYAPEEQEVFLRCKVSGTRWGMSIESNDLICLKHRHQDHREQIGRNYNQSPQSASHGHGRHAARRGMLRFSDRFENRVTDWIENRSIAIVRFAVDAKCGVLRMEDLSNRRPETLCLGSFPYFKLVSRVEQKCKDAGVKFVKTKSSDELKAMLSDSGQAVTSHQV